MKKIFLVIFIGLLFVVSESLAMEEQNLVHYFNKLSLFSTVQKDKFKLRLEDDSDSSLEGEFIPSHLWQSLMDDPIEVPAEKDKENNPPHQFLSGQKEYPFFVDHPDDLLGPKKRSPKKNYPDHLLRWTKRSTVYIEETSDSKPGGQNFPLSSHLQVQMEDPVLTSANAVDAYLKKKNGDRTIAI